MRMEYNHMEDLGFTEDKQLLCTVQGLLCSANSMKRMCDRFIRNGGKLYDILTAYDDIMMLDLSHEDPGAGDARKMLVPLLKASGVTDSSVYEYFVSDMGLMPNSGIIHYLNGLMTTQLLSEAYQHHSVALCECIDLPTDTIRCTEVSFDELDISKQDGKRLRDIASNLLKMDVPKVTISGDMYYIDRKDQTILDTIEEMAEKIEATDLFYQLEEMRPLGGNEKAFAVMDVRSMTNVGDDNTVYIGTNGTDQQAMDIIRSNEGLAMSFNGNRYAVGVSNVAVMSPDPIVAAVLTAEFYTGGMEGVLSMIDAWDPVKLAARECSDRHLMNTLLKAFPSKLPEVTEVNEDNVNDVIRESERFRRKLTV
jgi:energy-converting hydrogenase A subunit R